MDTAHGDPGMADERSDKDFGDQVGRTGDGRMRDTGQLEGGRYTE